VGIQDIPNSVAAVAGSSTCVPQTFVSGACHVPRRAGLAMLRYAETLA
jgi:hypothetical protein